MSKIVQILTAVLAMVLGVYADENYDSFISPSMATNPAYVAFMTAYDTAPASNRLWIINDMIQGNGDSEAVFILKMLKAENYRDSRNLAAALATFDEVIGGDTNQLHVYYAIRQKGIYYTLDGNATGTLQCAVMALQMAPSESETWRILYAIKYNNEIPQYDKMVSDYSCQKLAATTNVLMAERFYGLVTTNYYPQAYLKGLYSTVLSNLTGSATNAFSVMLSEEMGKMQ